MVYVYVAFLPAWVDVQGDLESDLLLSWNMDNWLDIRLIGAFRTIGGFAVKEKYVTITGMNHYYGLQPFKVGKKLKCIKEPDNPYDSEAIKVVIKDVGKVGYIANAPFTKATGTLGAGGIGGYVKKKFKVEVMFITSSKVICKVVDGFKKKEKIAYKDSLEKIERTRSEIRDDVEVEGELPFD